MVIRAKLEEILEYDDEGCLDGMQTHLFEPLAFPTIQSLLEAWLSPQKEGGYERFIEDHQLQGIVSEEQLAELFSNQKARMGKRLAGILSLFVPPEYSSWMKIRNMYERVGGKEGYVEIEITEAAANAYLEMLSQIEGLEFKQLLRMWRRSHLLTQKELADKADLAQCTIGNYESGMQLPNTHRVHKICDALQVLGDTRLQMLNSASNEEIVQLEDPKKWREGFAVATGAGSIFGALLYHLRSEKNWTQHDLAEKMKIHQNTISCYEKGRKSPNLATVHQLCDALEVSADTRLLMLNTISKGAITKLDNKKKSRQGFAAITGGGNIFGALLYHLRSEKHFTREDLTQKSGLTSYTISAIETGKQCANVAIVHKLCDALEIDSDTRILMLNAASKGAITELDDQHKWREGFKALTGNDSLFCSLLHNLRLNQKLTQQELALKVGVSHASVNRYETGLKIPFPKMVNKLCDALEVEPSMRETMLAAAACRRFYHRHNDGGRGL